MNKNNFIYFIKSIYCFRRNITKFYSHPSNHSFNINQQLSIYCNPNFYDPKGAYFFMALYDANYKGFYLNSKGPKDFENFILKILKKYHEQK